MTEPAAASHVGRSKPFIRPYLGRLARIRQSLPVAGWGSIPVRSLLVFVPLAAITAGFFGLVSVKDQEAQRLITDKVQEQIAEIIVVNFNSGISSGISDIRFLAREQMLQDWLADTSLENRSSLSEQYVSFLSHKPEYDSIRLIDKVGDELVRIDRHPDGSVRAFPPDELQSKTKRYYFRDSIGLPAGTAYVSPLDLNVENGRIEQPIRPMLRFAAPVHDIEGQTRGIVAVNRPAQSKLDEMSQEAALRNSEIWLVDENGYWLKGPDPATEWGFMYPEREAVGFATSFPEAWKRAVSDTSDIGQFTTAAGHFTFASTNRLNRQTGDQVGLSNNVISPNWYVVAHLSPERYSEIIDGNGLRLRKFQAAIYLALLVIAIGTGYHWHRRVHDEDMVLDLNRRLDLDNQSLAAVNSELEAFSYSVSHDLRTPLRSIDGFSLALLDDYGERLDETGRNYLDRVRKAAQRMGQLIDDLLALSRVSRSTIKASHINLSTEVRDVADGIQAQEPDRQVAWTIPDDIRGYGDPRLVRILVENLLGNAWKFTSGKADAHIAFGQDRTIAGKPFFIRDNGAGFDMAYADMLFNAFHRLHPEEEFSGTGIGLATTQRIINRHGGRIWAEAAPDKGATFYFTLGKERS
ncbi:ATP-binding protein [Hoeflea sp. AS60]|uniref:sensor histidine kinase n=1 Tax=Hoeflea sp. AS60 TaxID=3135780 RepID=UPI0031814567